MPAELALRHPHLAGGGLDLPLGPAFDDFISAHDLADRVRFYPGGLSPTSCLPPTC